MSFDTASCLRNATSRAKSDVANKLISMFLHDLSRRICAEIGLSVNDPQYANAVAKTFGSQCCYCNRPLEKDRAAVEHLEGMNRFRIGLHIPGNVVVSCKRCNTEKRRDDQLRVLVLAQTGWESFMQHGGGRCSGPCKSCEYWASSFNENRALLSHKSAATQRIRDFRAGYPDFWAAASEAKRILPTMLEALYREGQEFASLRIKTEVEKASSELIAGISGKIPRQL